jgi:Fanconi anemia group M protein
MKDLLKAQREIQARIREGSGQKSAYYSAASAQAAAVKVYHAQELVETQGITALKNYLERLGKEAFSRGGSRASKSIMNHSNIKQVFKVLDKIDIEHPKIGFTVQEVTKQFKKKKDSRVIVFTHYRDTSLLVTEELGRNKGIKPVRFVGQASHGEDKGLSQKQQVECIQDFKDGTYNVLVATSVAEEGLDIPSTDLVVFYEPVPSEIRTIQAYYFSSISKEKKMKRELHFLRTELSRAIKVGEPKFASESEIKNMIEKTAVEEDLVDRITPVMEVQKVKPAKAIEKLPKVLVAKESVTCSGSMVAVRNLKKPIETESPKKGQARLLDFEKKEKKPTIIADTREFNSEVVRELSRKGLIVESQQLDCADYVLSDRLAVERKEVSDFVHSLMDGRLFSQLKMLKGAYINPILVIEGEGLFTRGGINQNAIFGALASIISDFNISVIFTNDDAETANLLTMMARREIAEGRPVGIRGEKFTMSQREQQQFIIEGLPGVSATLAQRLLAHFGSVKAIMDADEKQLSEVKGIGETIAKGIVETVRGGYLKK